MAFIPIPRGVRVCMRYRKDGQMVCNVYHVRVANANPSLADLQAVGNVFAAWWNNTLQANMPNFVTLEAIEVRDASAQGQEGLDIPIGEAGSISSTALPNNVTFVIKLLTGLAGRSFRGRSYWPGVSSQMLATQNTITTTFAAVVQDVFEELIGLLAAEAFELAIASLFNNGQPRAAGVLTPVIGASVNLTLDSQRRRLPERGV